MTSHVAARRVAAKIDTFNQPGSSRRRVTGCDGLPIGLSAGCLGVEGKSFITAAGRGRPSHSPGIIIMVLSTMHEFSERAMFNCAQSGRLAGTRCAVVIAIGACYD
jgi:hypothetical protein